MRTQVHTQMCSVAPQVRILLRGQHIGAAHVTFLPNQVQVHGTLDLIQEWAEIPHKQIRIRVSDSHSSIRLIASGSVAVKLITQR